MVTIWSSDKPIRGTIPAGKDWPHGSRQVIRRGMTSMYVNQMARFDVSRRLRRSMARFKMHSVYQAVKAEQLAMGIEGQLPVPKQVSWLVALAKKAADIFKLEA